MLNKEATIKFHAARSNHLFVKMLTIGNEFTAITSGPMANDLRINGRFSKNNCIAFDKYTEQMQVINEEIHLSMNIIKQCNNGGCMTIGGCTVDGILTGHIKEWPSKITNKEFLDKIFNGEVE